MTIEVTGTVEEQLREIAQRQGRDVRSLVEEAVREFVEALAITDLDPKDVAEAQMALAHDFEELSMKAESRTDRERIDSMSDDDVDTSEIPPLSEELFAQAKLRRPRPCHWKA